MIVYIVATLLSLLCAYISVHIENSRGIEAVKGLVINKMFAFLSFVPLTFVMAVRRDVGRDYGLYWRWFSGTRDTLEPAFQFLNTVLRQLFGDPQSLFIVCAVIICGIYFMTIYKESGAPVYSILLFVITRDFFFSMNVMRQYVATAILLLSIPFFKKKNWIAVVCLLLIAFLFHKSSIWFAIIYIFSLVEVPPLIGGAIIAGMFVFSHTILKWIFPLLSRFGFYTNYFSSSKYGNESGDMALSYILIFLSFYLLLAYVYPKVKSNANLKLMYAAVFSSLLLLSMGAVLPNNVHRLVWYSNSFLVLYLPEAVRSVQDKRIRVLLNAVIVVFYFAITINYISNDTLYYVPYKSMWG